MWQKSRRHFLCSLGACSVVEEDKNYRKLANNIRWYSISANKWYKPGYKYPDPLSLGGISQVEKSQEGIFGQEE